MNNIEVMFSSNSDEWATPVKLFEELNEEFNFTLDPCATHENHKCEAYYTKADNGLEKKWGGGTSVCKSTLFGNKQVGGKSIL